MEPEHRSSVRLWLAERAPLLFGAGILFLSVFLLIVVETLTGH